MYRYSFIDVGILLTGILTRFLVKRDLGHESSRGDTRRETGVRRGFMFLKWSRFPYSNQPPLRRVGVDGGNSSTTSCISES